MFVGKQAWDPWQICKQIAVLQALFYLSLFLALVTFVGPFVEEFSANYLFSSAVTNTYSFVNTMVCLAYIVTAIVCAVGIRIVVARAKKCWDFGATIYILHLVASSTLVGFPLRWFWWALVLTCAAVTILLGELLCVRYEMADIPINTSARPAPAAASARGAARRRPQQRDEPDLEAQVPLKPRSTSTPGLAGWQELSSKGCAEGEAMCKVARCRSSHPGLAWGTLCEAPQQCPHAPCGRPPMQFIAMCDSQKPGWRRWRIASPMAMSAHQVKPQEVQPAATIECFFSAGGCWHILMAMQDLKRS